MNYIDVSNYKKKWIFTHQSMPVLEDDMLLIRPMSPTRAGQLWSEQISKQSPSVSHFSTSEWPLQSTSWQKDIDWQSAWDEDAELPLDFMQHFDWDDNVVVYFCYEKQDVIETKWGLFKTYWKNFLFYDDGPILLGKKKKEVAQFQQNGRVKLGKKP